MKNKYLYIVLGILILIIAYFIIQYTNRPEYTEIKDQAHIKGSPESSISLVEFSDFQCPACGSAYFVVKDLLETYGDKLKFEYRHFPLTSIHPYAFKAAEASECTADQDKFWEYHDILFLNQDNLRKNDLVDYAVQVEGLDQQLWLDCLNSRAKSDRVKEDLEEANRRGYNSTPTFILNGQKVENYGQLPQLIEALIQPLVPLEQATSTQSIGNVRYSL